jgi:glycopeptide antibiotics resistance protein
LGIGGIVFYTARALKFALPAGAFFMACRLAWLKRRGGRVDRKREALLFCFAVYIAALADITCIRSGAHLLDWWTLPHGMDTVQLVPLLRTWRMRRAGAWAILYPVLGNLLWFFPFGFLLPVLRPGIKIRRVALYALLLSLAIEVSQWVLKSGISDVDDLIFNFCGAIGGYGCFRLFEVLFKHERERNG